MNAKKMLLLGVALLGGWYSGCLSTFDGASDECVPLLQGYQDGQRNGADSEIIVPAYQSCPELNSYQPCVPVSEDQLQGEVVTYAIMPERPSAPPLLSGTQIQRYFMSHPFIETERMIMREPCCQEGPFNKDFEALKQVLTLYPEKLLSSFLKDWDKGIPAPWILQLKTGEVIGYCGIDAIKESDQKCVLVVRLLDKYCGQDNGYFEEAIYAVLNEVFSQEKLGLSEALIMLRDVVDQQSHHRIARIGFKLKNTQYDRIASKYEIVRCYAITRDQFFKLDEDGRNELLESESHVKKSSEQVTPDSDQIICDDQDQEINQLSAWFKSLWSCSQSRKNGYEKVTQ